MKRPVMEKLLAGVRSPRVRSAFARVDRRTFVLPEYRRQAWEDHPLPIEDGATISQPSLVARMTELLAVEPGYRVLEIGTGSGYQTAILAEMGAEVFSIEISERLSRKAGERLRQAGYASGIHLRAGDGRLGWPENGPFERILATVAFERLPDPLEEQLAEGGILIAPIGPAGGVQSLLRFHKQGHALTRTAVGDVRFLSAYP